MFTKMAIFGLGYVLGARAGRPRYDAIVGGARDIVAGEEVATAVGFFRGAFWILSQRGRSLGRRGP
ncbi:MAG: hypothetical protein M3024_03445 [Candidatus Dormibacteraeota bacterium]|nr:hypothetical protein [Candidatus Dormibacteraeota bacterium]